MQAGLWRASDRRAGRPMPRIRPGHSGLDPSGLVPRFAMAQRARAMVNRGTLFNPDDHGASGRAERRIEAPRPIRIKNRDTHALVGGNRAHVLASGRAFCGLKQGRVPDERSESRPRVRSPRSVPATQPPPENGPGVRSAEPPGSSRIQGAARALDPPLRPPSPPNPFPLNTFRLPGTRSPCSTNRSTPAGLGVRR